MLQTIVDLPAPKISKRETSRFRRWVKRIAVAAAAPLVLLGSAIGLAHTESGKDVIRAQVESTLSGKVNGKASIGKLDFGLLFSDLSLENVVIEDAAGRTAISLGKVVIDVDGSSLVDGLPVINLVAIDSLAVRAIEADDGSTNLDALFVQESSEKQSPPAFDLRELRVRNLSLSLDKADGTKINVSSVDIDGALRASPDGGVRATMNGMTANAVVARPGRKSIDVPASIKSLSASLEGGRAAFVAGPISLGPLTVDGIEVEAEVERGRLVGKHVAKLVNLRVASERLNSLLDQPMLATDVLATVGLTGNDGLVEIQGSVDTDGGNLTLSGSANLSSLETPIYDISLVGNAIDTGKLTNQAVSGLPSLRTSLALTVRGSGSTAETVKAEADLEIGATTLDGILVNGLMARAKVSNGVLVLEELTIDALGLSVGIEGRADLAKNLKVAVKARGNIRRAALALAKAGFDIGDKLPLPDNVELAILVNGNLDGVMEIEVPMTRVQIAGGSIRLDAKAKLAAKAGSDEPDIERLVVHGEVDNLSLGKLAALFGESAPVEGSLSGRLGMSKEGQGPEKADYALTAVLSRPDVVLDLSGTLDSRTLAAAIRGRRGSGESIVSIDASVPIKRKAGQIALDERGALGLIVDLPEQGFAELLALLPKSVRQDLVLPRGAIAARIELGGTLTSPTGEVVLSTHGEVMPGKIGRARFGGYLDSSRSGETTIVIDGAVEAEGVNQPIATLGGSIALGRLWSGGQLNPELATGAQVDLSLSVPNRELTSLGSLAKQLRGVPGTVAGLISVKGPATMPRIAGNLDWRGYTTNAGDLGQVVVEIAGTPKALRADLKVGKASAVLVGADIVFPAPGSIRATVEARAEAAPLNSLLPAFVVALPKTTNAGRLDVSLDALIEVAAGVVSQAEVTGTLGVNGGSLVLPGSTRRYEDITVRLAADKGGLDIERLSATERTGKESNRRVAATGRVEWTQLKPTRIAVDLRTVDWLLFGAEPLGPADAPRAEITSDIGIAIDLRGPRPSVEAEIRELSLLAPERYARGHGLEDVSHGGDVIFLDESISSVGALPVAVVSKPSQGKSGDPGPDFDIAIRIPKAIRVNLAPMDIRVQGGMTIAKRGVDTKVRGAMTATEGALTILGHRHELKSGRLEFSDDQPEGHMALVFQTPLPPAVLRDVAARSTAHGVELAIVGPVAKPDLNISGAAGAALFELMSMHNAGRGRFVAQPDMPASSTIQAPRGDQHLILTFLADNLPHMLFLDRFNAWADPYDGPQSYGQVKNFEGERYSHDNRSRVKAVMRPETEGRSTAELHYDRLWINDNRKAVGAGVRAGSRLGGGVGVFVEWSSAE